MTKCFKKRKSIWRSAACLGIAAVVLAASVSAQAAESVVLRPSGERSAAPKSWPRVLAERNV